MNENCGICLEPYTVKTRVKVTCQYCPVGACKVCQQNYLLSTYDDPHCYSCKQGWSVDFMNDKFPMIFRTKTLRFHRRKILLERQKSMLPAMQIFVEAKKKIVSMSKLSLEIYHNYSEKHAYLNSLRSKVYNLKIEMNSLYSLSTSETAKEEDKEKYKTKYKLKAKEVKTCEKEVENYTKEVYSPIHKEYVDMRREVYRWQRVYETGDDQHTGEKKVRREFLMRCPADECRGFLSTAYKCGICEKKTCSDCLEVLTEGDHICKSDAVETAKTIKSETRPCPKCGVRIFKIDGCDQMWCTVDGCGTAFSWDTGTIVIGRVHNPHYYEWLRRAGRGAAPREVGDIPCGGVPDFYQFAININTNPNISHAIRNTIFEIHRNVVEFEARLADYPAVPPVLYNKEINVKYLMNEITEEVWMKLLEHAEAKFNRKKEIGQILQTLVIAAADLLRDVGNRCLNPYDVTIESWIESEVLPALGALRTYTNESFESLSRSTRQAVPQIKDNWTWTPIRAIYKRSKNEIIDATNVYGDV